MFRFRWLILIAALAGCASAPQSTPEAERTIAEILSQPAEDVAPKRCLSVHVYDQVEVLDQRRVLFSGTGNKHWLNELRMPCVGLRRHTTLLFRLRTSQVCDMDSFHSVYDPWWRFSASSGQCALGTFQPVTAHQVMAIREALGIRKRDSNGPGYEIQDASDEPTP